MAEIQEYQVVHMPLSWRDHILREFTPGVARLTLVTDPDGLLAEEGILENIRQRGFELIPFDDRISFRYEYEARFRSRWDRGEQTDLVVVLRSAAGDLSSLPYDLLQAGRKLSFNLGHIFPNLSYPVVAALDRSDLDALYEAQRSTEPGPLGDNATKEFVLRHVFEIAPELIKQPADLLRTLLRRHRRGRRVPAVFDERFIKLLRQSRAFDDWPLETLILDREAFMCFVQERWPIFLDHMAANEQGIHDIQQAYSLAISGPEDLPFEHDDVRSLVVSLFLEGVLRPVRHECANVLSKMWVIIGVRADPIADGARRLGKLVKALSDSLPAEDARHGEWLHFSRSWGEVVVLSNALGSAVDTEIAGDIDALRRGMDDRFADWLLRRYSGLINLPPIPPVMLHHLARFLVHRLGSKRNARVALVVIDGLAMDQWLVIREALASRQPDLQFREQAVFAWAPSVTSVSRQAAFAGKSPVYFPGSIKTTDSEPALWTQFWADQGMSSNQIVYAAALGDGSLDAIRETLSGPLVRVAGLVIDKVDNIMHGMELGTAGMHNQVRQWAEQPYFAALLKLLLDQGFLIFLTSDHGNVEATGYGRPAEGAVADMRGERVRIYSDAALRAQVTARFPKAVEWTPIGLPEDYLPLLAPGRQAFVPVGQRIVSHGGVSLEEIIVPLVQIERKTA